MKNTPCSPPTERPDGRLNLNKQGYPTVPQGPTGIPCEGKPLRTPGATKPRRVTRTQVIKVRLTDDEMNRLVIPLEIKRGKRRGLSQVVRARLFASRLQDSSVDDCRRCRLLAAVVNNLNLIARRSLDAANSDTALQIIAHLTSLEREIRKAFNPGKSP